MEHQELLCAPHPASPPDPVQKTIKRVRARVCSAIPTQPAAGGAQTCKVGVGGAALLEADGLELLAAKARRLVRGLSIFVADGDERERRECLC